MLAMHLYVTAALVCITESLMLCYFECLSINAWVSNEVNQMFPGEIYIEPIRFYINAVIISCRGNPYLIISFKTGYLGHLYIKLKALVILTHVTHLRISVLIFL